MSRLIDADEFCLDIKTGRIKETYYLSNMHKQMIIDQIDKRKTIDAVPVVHGHWEMKWHTYFHQELPVCSCCRKFAVVMSAYCPHCGAKLEEVTE